MEMWVGWEKETISFYFKRKKIILTGIIQELQELLCPEVYAMKLITPTLFTKDNSV